MCGISAIVGEAGDAVALGARLQPMHAALAHRGPDGDGFLAVTPEGTAQRAERWPAGVSTPLAAAIGFRQLKIQDLSDAAIQPLGTADARVWLARNGEVYNASELRHELDGRGHRFRTRTDTEVVLAAYREWGLAAFDRLRGMWAMLLVDLDRRMLIGSRDRLGIKPLYYAVDGGRLVLASEPQAVACGVATTAAVQRDQLAEFLAGLPPQSSDRTFFDGVRVVPPGCLFEVPLDGARCAPPSFSRYWNAGDYVADAGPVPTRTEASDAVRAQLLTSVAEHSVAAVPVGCLLSGGVDTSFIACALGQAAGPAPIRPLQAYSIAFRDADMSELPFIWTVRRASGLEGHTRTLTPDEAWRSIDRVVLAQGQPLLGQDLIAQYHAYDLAREQGAVVVLDGQGSDELLAGMPSYAAAFHQQLLRQGRVAAFAREVAADARRRGGPDRRAWTLALGSVAMAVRGPRRHAHPPWLSPDLALPRATTDDWTPSRDPSRLNRQLHQLVTRTNLQTVLQAQDRSGMIHGIESRVPFLDHRFVEYCLRLPACYKVRDGIRKRVLVDAARGLVPEAILARRDKKTFVSKGGWMPLRDRYHAPLREMAEAPMMRRGPWFVRDAVPAFVDGYLDGRHDDAAAVWRLYTAWRWMTLFAVTA